MADQNYPEQQYVVTALFRYIIAGVIFIILVAVFAWFFFFRDTGDSGNVATKDQDNSTTSQSIDGSSKSDEETSGGDNSASSGGNDQSTSTTDSSSDGSTSASDEATSSDTSSTTDTLATDTDGASADNGATPSSGELTNTGPGEVLALFIGVTLLATAFKRMQLNRQ